MKRAQIEVTLIIEFDLDPDNYPSRGNFTELQMLQYEIDDYKSDPWRACEDTDVVKVVGKILD